MAAGNMAKVLPEYLSDWSTQKAPGTIYRRDSNTAQIVAQGVQVIPNETIQSVNASGGACNFSHVP